MTVGLDTDLMFRRILIDAILLIAFAAFVAGVILRAIVKKSFRRWKGRTVWVDCDRKLADRLRREGRE